MKPEERGGSPKGMRKHPPCSLDARVNTRRLSQGLVPAECQRNRRTLWAVRPYTKRANAWFPGISIRVEDTHAAPSSHGTAFLRPFRREPFHPQT